MKNLEECFNFVLKHFNGDYEKTLIWFYMPNEELGRVSPMWMIMHERTDALLKLIDLAINDHR